MSIQRLICGLVAAASTAFVAAPAASADTTSAASAGTTPATTASGGSVQTVAAQSAVSANWSGYVAGSNGGAGFSSVSGSWTQPSVNCSSGQGNSSFWVGLGGSGGQSGAAGGQSGALEQVGTAADCTSSGTASHYAWYELVPSPPVRLNLTISPGDRMSGTVSVSGTNITVSLVDHTTGASATRTLQMSNPDVSTAEWIAEAPSQCDGSGCQPLPLANFGKVDFSQASATAGGHTGTISDPSWSAQPVALGAGAGGYDSSTFVSGQASGGGAQASGLSSDGSAFSVSYGSAAGTSTVSSSGDGGYGSTGSGSGASTGGYDP
ncbi:MAG: hypothetical protein JO179_01450, partial [Solirubrobacterales bacterium]|nr:hypothetical protein [Solirubrobacterales bacterium]